MTPSRKPLAAIVAYCCFATLCIMWSIVLGKDLPWDLYNYHLYAPHAALHYTLDSDFMGAGWVRYLNPYSHVPLYWMVMADWPAILIVSLSAAVHALNVFLLWWICRYRVFSPRPEDRDWVALGTFLGCATVVFLGIVGSTFSDPIVSVLPLLAIVALPAAGAAAASAARLVLVGALLGAATGFKLTNVVFALALCAAIALLIRDWRTLLRVGALLAVGGTLGFLAVNGYWAVQLYQEFGNPVFPLMNHLFASPDFPADAIRHERFTPTGWLEVLTFPFRAVQHATWIYYESPAPDWRFAFAVTLGIGLIGRILFLRRHDAPALGDTTRVDRSSLLVLWFVGISYVLWQLSSGNARYALPLLLLLGPVCALFAKLVVPRRPSLGKSLLITLAAVQCFVLLHVGNPRWGESDWSRKLIELDVPAHLKGQPHGYLSLGLSSNSVIAPFVHRDSRFSNIVGMHVIDPHGPGHERIDAFIKRHSGKLRSLSYVGQLRIDRPGSVPRGALIPINAQLAPWKLQVDAQDCAMILRPEPNMPKMVSFGNGWLSCGLVQSAGEDEATRTQRVDIERAMNTLQQHCSKELSPPQSYAYRIGGMWIRYYVNTDTKLYFRKGRLAYSRYDFGPFDVDLGSLEEVLAGLRPEACR